MDSQLPQSTLSTTNEEKMTSYGFEYATVTPSPPKRRAGCTKFQETRHPVFRGVRRRGKGKRWVCEVRDTNKNNNNKSRIWLGPFPTAEMAARAHDVAVMSLRGQNACLNFADSAWRLTMPCSASREDIRRVSSIAAEMFRLLSPSDETEADPKQTTSLSESEYCLSKAVTVEAYDDTFDAVEFRS